VAIAQASIQPAALRSGIERDLLLSRLCSRRTVPATVIHEEIDALKRLDVPYFARRPKGRSPYDESVVPPEIIEALRRALSL
jgi:lantibiotic modifying enzyme